LNLPRCFRAIKPPRPSPRSLSVTCRLVVKKIKEKFQGVNIKYLLVKSYSICAKKAKIWSAEWKRKFEHSDYFLDYLILIDKTIQHLFCIGHLSKTPKKRTLTRNRPTIKIQRENHREAGEQRSENRGRRTEVKRSHLSNCRKYTPRNNKVKSVL
jgi:hypothetical protein